MSISAFAECPSDKIGLNKLKNAPQQSSGTSTELLSKISLAAPEKINLENRSLRMRNIIIQPGGHVLLHSHDDRPALALVSKGEVIEHVNNCTQAITHHSGSIIQEHIGITHWVENKTNKISILTVSDIVNEKSKSQGNFNSKNH